MEELNNQIEDLHLKVSNTENDKAEYEQLYKISEQKLAMLQELNDALKMENNRLRSSYDKVGEESSFVKDKIKNLSNNLEELNEENRKLSSSLQQLRDENSRLKEEAAKKADQLSKFNDTLNNIKVNVENEKSRNQQSGLENERLLNELKIRDTENLRLEE